MGFVLLLVTILLVLIAAVTLLIGIFGDNLALIFVSIGASALAAIVLAVLSQMSRRKARDATTAATAPEPLATEPAVTSAPAGVTPVAAAPPEAPTLTDAPVAAAGGGTATAVATLPIAGYDSLRVNEILPKLEGLDLDQLEEVAQHEESTKNRTTILNRIDELMDQLEAEEVGAPVADAVDADVAEEPDEELAEAIESGDTVPEAAVSGGFPIPDYESLGEDDVIAMLGDLDADELEEVAEYEETHANRDRVLDAIDDRLDELEGIAPAAGAPAAAATPSATVKKATTKKASAKKAVAKKAAAKRAATPAKRQTSVSKAAVSVKKSAAATKATSKAATKKAAATVKRTGATKKAAPTVKKATTAKKATATKKATKAAKKSR